MPHSETEDFQLYYTRLKPVYHQLFNMAHAVTGNRERAQYCLQCTILDCWTAGDADASSHGFRESLRNSILRTSLKSTPAADEEFDWNGLCAEGESAGPLLQAIAQERLEMRRILALRYGCGLSCRRIGRLMGLEARRIQTLLLRFEARTRRRLSAADRRRYDLLIVRSIRSRLSQPSADAPEMGSVFRTFQADAATVTRPSRLPVRILRAVLIVLMALFCIVAFWFTAVLMQPAVLEDPVQIAESAEK